MIPMIILFICVFSFMYYEGEMSNSRATIFTIFIGISIFIILTVIVAGVNEYKLTSLNSKVNDLKMQLTDVKDNHLKLELKHKIYEKEVSLIRNSCL